MIRVNPRERRTILAGGVSIVALLAYLLVVSPYMSAMERLDRRIARKTEELAEVLALQAEYLSLKEKAEALEKMVRSAPGFSLLSFLENLAVKKGIKKQIAYMKPLVMPGNEKYQESSVEMKLEGLTLKELVEYLYQVEQSSQPIRIRRLNIVKRKGEPYLDMTLQASIFEPVRGGAPLGQRKG
ncbi:MAG: type II secretion system protein M [Deltaproteobacteria bacterium]|nr:type II secretion system protein M [Deltaproteobacteria bacterium]